MASGLEVAAGAQVVLKKDGVTISNIGPDPGPNNVNNNLQVLTGGTATLYFKVWETGYSLWLEVESTQ